MIVIPTCVYRFYDVEDHLLYVGVTDSPGARFGAHRAAAIWWPLAARNTLKWYDTRDEALVAEGEAISSESPRYNVAGPVRVVMPTTRGEFDALPAYVPRPYKPRRARGEGSLYLKKRPGKKDIWIARIDVGIGPQGQRLIKEASSLSREVAERKLAELKAKYHAA